MDTANDLLTRLLVSRLRSRRAPAPYEIGFAAFELRRSALDLHVPALQRGALETAAQYSWDGVAERTVAVYDGLLAREVGRVGRVE